MNFAWPYVLIALPFVLAGLLALFAGSRRARARLLGNFASARLLPVLLTSYSPAMRVLKHVLIATGVLLVVATLARPQWGYDWQQNTSRGVDVVFVLDTSRSMLTPDVPPDRLERAKLAIYDCVQKMPGNRVGLVAFAGDAFLQCPLTLDYDAFRQTLDAVDTNTIARGGTDIAVGLDAAATALEKSGNHKIIVLLTDGEDLEGQGIAEAKTLAQQDVTIYTVGVGTNKGEVIPIPGANGGTDFVRNTRGDLVTSKLDSTTLSDIANATHGFYEPLGPTGEGLERVYEDGIKKLPGQNLQSQMSREPIERYQWPLAASTLLLTLEMLLGTRRPGWRRRAITVASLSEPLSVATLPAKPPAAPAGAKVPPVVTGLLLFALILPSITRARAADTVSSPATVAAAASDSSADTTAPTVNPAAAASSSPIVAENLFQKGDYPAAASAYAGAADTAPNDGRFRYDQGESLYRNKDYEGAAQAFTKSLAASDLPLQQRAYYNLGNTHYRLGQTQLQQDPQKTEDTWGTAIKDYQNALDLDPSDADARYNLNLVKKQLDDLKKQQEQQKQQQQQNQNNQNKDQQQQDQNQQNQNNQNQQNQDQNKQDQNNQNQQDQNKPNQNSQQNQQNQPQNSQNQNQQNSPDKQNPQQAGGQKPDQQNGGQPKDQQNPPGQPGQNQPKNPQAQNQKPAQNSPDKNQPAQNGPQQKPNQTANNGKEPSAPNAGQKAPGASTSSGNSGNAAAGGTVMVGVMTRDEAQQLLDSLKPDEHKLPALRVETPAQSSSSDQTYKDW